jgi:hypothetical protein
MTFQWGLYNIGDSEYKTPIQGVESLLITLKNIERKIRIIKN